MIKDLIIFISGNGTNLQKIIDEIKDNKLNATISLVVSNRKNAYGLIRAETECIETLYYPFIKTKMDRIKYDILLANKIIGYKPDFIVCVGWMHILSKEFLEIFPNKVINLHPALPGKFPGKDSIVEAYNYYQKYPSNSMHTGAMVHYVIPEIDAGKTISTIRIKVKKEDTIDSLRTRVQKKEKIVLMKSLQLLCN